jgi:hypothetical protein
MKSLLIGGSLLLFPILTFAQKATYCSRTESPVNAVRCVEARLPSIPDAIYKTGKIMQLKPTQKVFRDRLNIAQRLWTDSDDNLYYPRVEGCTILFLPMADLWVIWE